MLTATIKTAEELYFEWLCIQGLGVGDRGAKLIRPYQNVCEYLHGIIFKDDVPNDDNRSAEGVSLRDEFYDVHWDRGRIHFETWDEFRATPATIFETLVGMARRCDFQVPLGVTDWFMIFLKNLHIDQFDDDVFVKSDRIKLSKRVNPFNNRTYSPSGAGGIFPLKRPHTDMRKLELWYQMSAYIMENRMIT